MSCKIHGWQLDHALCPQCLTERAERRKALREIVIGITPAIMARGVGGGVDKEQTTDTIIGWASALLLKIEKVIP